MFDELFEQLKEAREKSAAAREAKRQIIEAAQSSTEYRYADETTTAADEAITRLENEIRSAAVNGYVSAGIKKPHPSVTVKMFTTVAIPDEAAAREWCFINFRPALKFDAKTFEKAVKDGAVPAVLASTQDEPRAQIATKL